jgi:hypothetical protein
MSEPGGVDDLLGPQLRLLRILAGALIMGLVVFVVVAVVVVQQGGGGPGRQGAPMLTYVALLFLVAQLGVWAILPAAVSRRRVQDIAAGTWAPGRGAAPAAFPHDTARLLMVFTSQMIISYALLEGASFLGGIAYLVEAELLALAVPGVGLVLMVLTFPTRQRVRSWLEGQQSRVEELRHAGGLGGSADV